MINTIDDFMKRFGSGETVDDQQAAQLHDRFVSARAEDSQFDNRAYHEAAAEYIGRLPDDQFRNAARNAGRIYSEVYSGLCKAEARVGLAESPACLGLVQLIRTR